MVKWLSIACLIFPSILIAQSAHPILRDFTGVQQGETVVLTWTIKGGNTCQGTRIQRFNEQQVFEEIGEYDGICGNSTSDEKYEFVDTSPLPNQANLYRLELGQQGFTNVIEVQFYTYNDEDYVILGNPVISASKIIFANPNNNECLFMLHDMNGRLIHHITTTLGEIELYSIGWSKGNYLFNISSSEGITIKGMLNVQ